MAELPRQASLIAAGVWMAISAMVAVLTSSLTPVAVAAVLVAAPMVRMVRAGRLPRQRGARDAHSH